MKVVTTDQIRELDRRTIASGISGRGLMEKAGRSVGRVAAHFLSALDSEDSEPSFSCLVLAYKGCNGGDALVAARELIQRNQNVRVALFGAPNEFKGDSGWHLKQLKAASRKKNVGKLDLVTVRDAASLEKKAELRHDTVVIDGLFGMGLKRPLGPPFDEVVRWVNASGARIIAVDVPSGLDADSGKVLGEGIRADITVTMGLPKIGLLRQSAIDYVGKLVVADLPYPPEFIAEIKTDVHLIHESDLRPFLPRRKYSAHKGDFGHVLIVAGSQGLIGAANLCATASVRSGAGLTTLCVPDKVYSAVAAAAPPEVMVRPLSDTHFENFAQRVNVLACGCGLGQSAEAKSLVEILVRRWSQPMVLDADALNAIAPDPNILLDAKAPIIITPHPREMARLIGKTVDQVQADRWEIAKQFARRYKVIVILKGARTVVASPLGEIWVNSTGNPAMASGGVGDTLTGVIAALLAQKLKPFDAARAGVYLHGLAGDLAAQKRGERAILASDLLTNLGSAFATLT